MTAFATFALLGLAGAAGYALACAVAPFRPCLVCRGTGQRGHGRRLRPCWHCHGKARRLRLGRRAFNHFARVRKAGTRTPRVPRAPRP